MPVFNDRNSVPALLAEGDYIFCVTGFDIGISNGAKTRGSEKYDLELEIEPSGKRVYDILIDHAVTSWKIDVFLKSAGVPIAKGEAFEFREDTAASNNVKWVNPIGLRGWCHITQETLPAKQGYDKPLTVNKVSIFYTDKPNLAARVQAEEEKPF